VGFGMAWRRAPTVDRNLLTRFFEHSSPLRFIFLYIRAYHSSRPRHDAKTPAILGSGDGANPRRPTRRFEARLARSMRSFFVLTLGLDISQ